MAGSPMETTLSHTSTTILRIVVIHKGLKSPRDPCIVQCWLPIRTWNWPGKYILESRICLRRTCKPMTHPEIVKLSHMSVEHSLVCMLRNQWYSPIPIGCISLEVNRQPRLQEIIQHRFNSFHGVGIRDGRGVNRTIHVDHAQVPILFWHKFCFMTPW